MSPDMQRTLDVLMNEHTGDLGGAQCIALCEAVKALDAVLTMVESGGCGFYNRDEFWLAIARGQRALGTKT